MNKYISFYNQYEISPVAQDLNDWQRHASRRWGLYRQLGVLPMMIQGKKIAEIGPGGGHNALVTLQARPLEYILIEPSNKGFRQLTENIDSDNKAITYYHMKAEEYVKQSNDRYDIVICEGLIPGLDNKEFLLDALDLMLVDGGVMIITCADTVSLLFENIRKALALVLTIDIENFHQKIKVLCKAFGTHFATLKGASRNLEDWVVDLMLNPASYNSKDFFTIEDALNYFGSSYFYLGSSPQFLKNYTWYKELPLFCLDYNRLYIENYKKNRHHLLHYQEIFPLEKTQNRDKIHSLSNKIALHVDSMFDCGKRDLTCLIAYLQELKSLLPEETTTVKALDECLTIIQNENFTPESIAEAYPVFKAAFGRGQQYLSLVKKE